MGPEVTHNHNNLAVLRKVPSKMVMEDIKSCIGGLKGFEIQRKEGGIVCPYWGVFIEAANKLPAEYFEKIREAVYLEHFGDISKPTSVIIRFRPEDYAKINNRWVRAIKIKGVTSRIEKVKRGELRHIRFLGSGNIAFLMPYTRPDGTRGDVRYDVGEPYMAKRFRSVFNEVVLTQYAFWRGRAVMAPIGMGIYEDDELLYKGEPTAFSIWGTEHPDDLRSADELDARFFRMLDEMDVCSSEKGKWEAFEEALLWMYRHHAGIIAEMRRNHDAGLVHHEVHFNNTMVFDNSLTIADWEEGAHRCNLTKAQFLDSVVIDLMRLIENCLSEEMVYRQHYNRACLFAKDCGTGIPAFRTVNYFTYYFREDEISYGEREKLQSLQEKLLTQSSERTELIERVLRKLVFAVFDKGQFGKGMDWEDAARPYMSGFSDVGPVWQPEATTTFDPKLFVQKGGWPYGKKQRYPTEAIRRAEEAIYEGRFEDAIKFYENVLRYGRRRRCDIESYIHHNLASLYLAVRRDEEAKKHFADGAFSF